MPTRMEQLTVWVPAELKKEFREWCKKEGYRSMGEAVRWWVRWAVRGSRQVREAERATSAGKQPEGGDDT